MTINVASVPLTQGDTSAVSKGNGLFSFLSFVEFGFFAVLAIVLLAVWLLNSLATISVALSLLVAVVMLASVMAYAIHLYRTTPPDVLELSRT